MSRRIHTLFEYRLFSPNKYIMVPSPYSLLSHASLLWSVTLGEEVMVHYLPVCLIKRAVWNPQSLSLQRLMQNIIWMLPAWRAAALLDTHMPTLTMLYLMCTWLYLCGFEALLCWWVITLVELCGPAEVMLCTFMIQADSISACVGLFLNVFMLVYACSSTLSRYITKGVFTRYDVNLVLYIFTMKSKPQMASLLWHQRANQNALKC